METTILEELKNELSNEPGFDETMLLNRVKNAIREVKLIRRYPSSYTEEMILSDMEKYYSVVREVALYDYNLIGAEGEETHSENGVSRKYRSRNLLFSDVIPLARL